MDSGVLYDFGVFRFTNSVSLTFCLPICGYDCVAAELEICAADRS